MVSLFVMVVFAGAAGAISLVVIAVFALLIYALATRQAD